MAETLGSGDDIAKIPTPQLREGLQSVADGNESPGDLTRLYRTLMELSKRTGATLDSAEFNMEVLQGDGEDDQAVERVPEQPTIH